MRLIDADALVQRAVPLGWSTPKWVSDIAIEDAPTIDAVPVLRCKDCKHYKAWDGTMLSYCAYYSDAWFVKRAWDYCSRGERKDDETD